MKKYCLLLGIIWLLIGCSEASFIPSLNFDSAFDTISRLESKYNEVAELVETETESYYQLPSGNLVGNAFDGSVSYVYLNNLNEEQVVQLANDFHVIDFDLALVLEELTFFESSDVPGVYFQLSPETAVYSALIIKQENLIDNVEFQTFFNQILLESES